MAICRNRRGTTKTGPTISAMTNQTKPSLGQWWSERLAKSTMTPEQKREATKTLLRLMRARRAHQEAWTAIDKAKRRPDE